MMKKTAVVVALLVAVLAFGASSASAATKPPPQPVPVEQQQAAKTPVKAVTTALPFGVSNIGWHWCCPPHWKVYFNKSATRSAAAAGGTVVGMITAGCALIGGPAAAAACIARWGYIVARAQIAKANGKCLYVAWAPTQPWWVWAGSHGGSGCR